MDDIESKGLIRDLGRRRDSLKGFLEILDANNQDQEPLRKERIIQFIETTVKFMDDVYMFLQSQTLLNSSYTKRIQTCNEILSLLSEHQTNPLVKKRFAELFKEYEESF